MVDFCSYLRVSTGITGIGTEAQRDPSLVTSGHAGELLAEFIEVESGPRPLDSQARRVHHAVHMGDEKRFTLGFDKMLTIRKAQRIDVLLVCLKRSTSFPNTCQPSGLGG